MEPKTAVKVLARTAVTSVITWDLIPYLFLWLLTQLSSLQAVGLRASDPHWMLAKDHLWFLPHGSLQQGGFLLQGDQPRRQDEACTCQLD